MPSHRFYGWKVVWVAFLVAVFGWGTGFYGPPVLLQTLHAARGWPISTISAAITLHFLFSALMVVNLPEMHRRFGIGRVTSAGAVLTGLGIIAWANTQHAWQMFPAALLTGAGYAAMSAAAINAMVSRWFERDRPKALSLALNGASVGGVIFAPLLVYLIATLGFEIATLAIATGIIAVTWPLAIRFLGPAPEDVVLTPDGRSDGASVSRPLKATPTRGQLLRDRRFVTMSAPFALGLFAQVGLSRT